MVGIRTGNAEEPDTLSQTLLNICSGAFWVSTRIVLDFILSKDHRDVYARQNSPCYYS